MESNDKKRGLIVNRGELGEVLLQKNIEKLFNDFKEVWRAFH